MLYLKRFKLFLLHPIPAFSCIAMLFSVNYGQFNGCFKNNGSFVFSFYIESILTFLVNIYTFIKLLQQREMYIFFYQFRETTTLLSLTETEQDEQIT